MHVFLAITKLIDDEVTAMEIEGELEALELMYNDKDDNDYCEGFLYKDLLNMPEKGKLVLKYPY